MRIVNVALALLSWFVAPPQRPRRDERGLSQSTENAILLAGAVAVATVVITMVTAYVRRNLPQ
ncbi:hypothetical protein [Propioniferax innocua]|uniref:Uncharacterized protein n=1 Tax=Propioniferax innocua TaxID=1753 RepID=A0A542Z8F4_9ACTN|nr:hypothetical protein [Propioniferax innocua]TQL56616.1 hypothetical protein FB460_2509 [Propioniferax innocua]